MIPARAASKLVVVMPATYGESRRRASTRWLKQKIGRRSGWNRALRGGKCNRADHIPVGKHIGLWQW